MTAFESSEFSSWIPLVLVPFLIAAIVGFACWYSARRRHDAQRPDRKRPVHDTMPTQATFLPRPDYTPSPSSRSLPAKSRAASTSQLTTTDIAYLDKLVRTASDRSMWKRDHTQHDKTRRVPSGQIH